jgi:hypothetical protein
LTTYKLGSEECFSILAWTRKRERRIRRERREGEEEEEAQVDFSEIDLERAAEAEQRDGRMLFLT